MSNNRIVSKARQWLDTFYIFLESDVAPFTDLPIYIGTNPNHETDYIYMNCEQMTRPSELCKCLHMITTKKPLEVWDYSIENIRILKSHGIKAKHVPLRTPQTYKDTLNAWRHSIEYDVGFCGHLSERRQEIIQALEEKGLTVLVVNTWGEERDKQLAKCKIHINIHCAEDYKIFESARCEPWLSIGVPIVSETSLDDDPRCINTDYNTLVDTVVSLFAKQDKDALNAEVYV
jgi:hypothetical protein